MLPAKLLIALKGLWTQVQKVHLSQCLSEGTITSVAASQSLHICFHWLGVAAGVPICNCCLYCFRVRCCESACMVSKSCFEYPSCRQTLREYFEVL